MDANENILVKVGFSLDGDWHHDTEYLELSVVQHGKGAYAAKVPNEGVEPGTDEDVWQMIAYIGADGRGLVVLPNGNIGYYDNGELVDSGISSGASIDIDNITVNFSEPSERVNVETGDNMPVLFGKISKWFSNLKALAFKDKVDWDNDINNRPSIPTVPTKVGAFENDSQFQSLSEVNQNITERGYQTSTQVNAAVSGHNTSEIAHNDIRVKLSDIEAIARGKSRAKVFNTIAELDAWIAVAANVATLQIGDNFYIRAVDVPDYWWDGSVKLPIEGEKVDLTEYLKATDATTRFVEKEAGKGLSMNDFTNEDKADLAFYRGTQTRTSISSIPVTVAMTFATISSNQTFSLSGTLVPGRIYTTRIKASGAQRTVALPTTGVYVTNDVSSIAIPNGKEAEISVLCVTASEYSLRVIEP